MFANGPACTSIIGLNRLNQVRIQGVDHPRRHCPVDFEVGSRNFPTVLIIGDDDLGHPAAKVFQVAGDGEMAMTSWRRDLKAGLHFIAVHSAALADRDAAALDAEIIARICTRRGHFKTLEIASGGRHRRSFVRAASSVSATIARLLGHC